VSDGETTWSPESGQMQLDFAVAELATRAAPMARRAAKAAREVEDECRPETVRARPGAGSGHAGEARDAYRRALELDAHHADRT